MTQTFSLVHPERRGAVRNVVSLQAAALLQEVTREDPNHSVGVRRTVRQICIIVKNLELKFYYSPSFTPKEVAVGG